MVAASSRIGRAGVLAVILSLVMLCGCAANGGSSQGKASQGAGTSQGQPAQGASAPEGQVQRGTVDFKPNNIPVMYVNVDESAGATIAEMNASRDHSVECKGTVDLVVPEGYAFSYGNGRQESLKDVKLDYIRGRGNSTWSQPKKPYKLKFAENQDLFGMGANKHWVLLANYLDSSLLRNRLTNWIARRLGMEFVMQDVPVDLVMNGMYLGSYVLCEHVRVGKSRVAIDELTASDADGKAISGGYLVALCPKYGEPPESVFSTSRGVEFLNETPSFDPDGGGDGDYANDVQRDYIRSYLQETEDAIFGEGGRSYTDYIDAQSFADCWLIQEFTCNDDAFLSPSNYLYKKRGGKLYWGPLWDFDLSYNFDQRLAQDDARFQNIEMPWLDRLREDPNFLALIVNRWKDLDGLLDEVTCEGGLLDSYREEIRSSWNSDDELCRQAERGSGAVDRLDTIDQEVESMREWIETRRSWMREHIGEAGKVTYTLTFTADGRVVDTVKVRVGEMENELPEPPEKDGYRFDGWYVGDEKVFDASEADEDGYFVISGDLTAEARYVQQ